MSDRHSLRALQACAAWLALCLEIGWKREQLDELEALWWVYHDRAGGLRIPLDAEGDLLRELARIRARASYA